MSAGFIALLVVVFAVPVVAQDSTDPAAGLQNEQPTWENYSRNPNVTALGFALRSIAARRIAPPPPAELAELIAKGLADGHDDSREGALVAIASVAALRSPLPDSIAVWRRYREALEPFRTQVEAMLHDPHESVRHSARMAFAALHMRPAKEKPEWVLDLDDGAVRKLIDLYDHDPGARPDVLNALSQCQCDTTLEIRSQLFRQAIYNAEPGVLPDAIRGAAELKMVDVLPRVVQMLQDPDPLTRQRAATALQIYGSHAAVYAAEMRAALGQETDPQTQGILKAALEMLSPP